MKPCKNIEELRRECLAVTSVVAGDTKLGAKALLFIAERIDAALRPRKKSRPTRWQRYFGAGMRAGKPPREIAAAWRAIEGKEGK